MQRIFGVIKQAFRKGILILSLVSLVSLSSVLFYNQPSYAATVLSQVSPEEEFERAESSESADVRGEAYERATQDTTLRDEEKAYEENLESYKDKEEKPGGGLVEGAKGLFDKATGGGSTGRTRA